MRRGSVRHAMWQWRVTERLIAQRKEKESLADSMETAILRMSGRGANLRLLGRWGSTQRVEVVYVHARLTATISGQSHAELNASFEWEGATGFVVHACCIFHPWFSHKAGSGESGWSTYIELATALTMQSSSQVILKATAQNI